MIASYRYVSRTQALAIEAKQAPALVKSLTSNPLPDSFVTTPKPHVGAHKLIAELRAEKFRGVTSIAGHTAGGLGCGFLP